MLAHHHPRTDAARFAALDAACAWDAALSAIDPSHREAFTTLRDEAHEYSAAAPDAALEHLYEAAFFERVARSNHPDRGAAACVLGHSLYRAGLELESYHQKWPPILIRLRVWVAALEALLLARSELGDDSSTEIPIFRIGKVLPRRIAVAQEFAEDADQQTARLIGQAKALLTYCE
jgi:hypothetical protein